MIFRDHNVTRLRVEHALAEDDARRLVGALGYTRADAIATYARAAGLEPVALLPFCRRGETTAATMQPPPRPQPPPARQDAVELHGLLLVLGIVGFVVDAARDVFDAAASTVSAIVDEVRP